jgi:oligopeptide/dipeptide ABC transporter ATP-binding protein
MDNILEVKNLRISFRTNSGTVKAVRDISFNLRRGETLAIVGESGSGKSVTSKAILGILAGNSITEKGEILYDGKDLLKISEEEMCKIRGDKISMIFQDPLSSLDPIVKIGRQITEAMLLKNKQNRKIGRIEFNELLETLKTNMVEAMGEASEEQLAEISELIKTFDSFSIKANELENNYNQAYTHAEEIIAEIDDKLFMAEKHQKIDVKLMLQDFIKKLAFVKDVFLTAGHDDEIAKITAAITNERVGYTAPKLKEGEPFILDAGIASTMSDLRKLMVEVTSGVRPNFFRIGFYCIKNPEFNLQSVRIDELNNIALNYLNENFMNRFIELATLGVKNSYEKSLEKKKEVIRALEEAKKYFANTALIKSETAKYCKELSGLVAQSIDKLQYIKDSVAGSFASSMATETGKYFFYEKHNPKEERRFEKQSAKREALIAKGKNVDWKVVPKVVYDLDMLRDNILLVIERLHEKYTSDISKETPDYKDEVVGLIDYLKEKASQVVYVVTKRMAQEKAIKLMEEVGIPEPRIRYNQYPFEFSGGMRQRIVIAIALAANPDILICDEPTTALDVTIQAQILELINNLKRERNLSVIFITHDLGVVANMADRIAVMYAGKIVEEGTADDVFYDPRHPYTWALLSSMPDLDTNEKLDAIPGTPPNMIYPPKGDAFAPRNKYALKIDFEEQPPMFDISETHRAATWLLHPDAPKVEIPKIITERIERMKKSLEGEA